MFQTYPGHISKQKVSFPDAQKNSLKYKHRGMQSMYSFSQHKFPKKVCIHEITVYGEERYLEPPSRRVPPGDEVHPQVPRVAGEYDRLVVRLAGLEHDAGLGRGALWKKNWGFF